MGYRSVTNVFVGTLDDVPDGAAFRRVAHVAGAQISAGSIGAAAVQSYHIAEGQIGPAHTIGWTGIIYAYNGAFTVINGLVVDDGSSSSGSSGTSWPEDSSGSSSGSGDSSSSGDSSGSGEGSGV